MSENIVHTTDDAFETDVINADKPVLVDYWAEWCGPCKMIAPILDEIAVEQEGKLKIGKLNVDEDGGDHLAGATPFGPEVDEHRLGGTPDLLVEAGCGQCRDAIGHEGVPSVVLSSVHASWREAGHDVRSGRSRGLVEHETRPQPSTFPAAPPLWQQRQGPPWVHRPCLSPVLSTLSTATPLSPMHTLTTLPTLCASSRASLTDFSAHVCPL